MPPQPPDLQITTGGQTVEISCSNRTWTATLGSGDHVVRLPAPGDSWFEAPITFALGAPATIIIPGDTANSPLVTWTATGGTTRDSKNPWPPPLSKIDDAPLSDPTWLGSTLTSLKLEVSTDRSAPGQLPPASTAKPGRFR